MAKSKSRAKTNLRNQPPVTPRTTNGLPSACAILNCTSCDLDRWTRITFILAARDLDNSPHELLSFCAIENTERPAAELKAAFYQASGDDGATLA